MKTLATSFVLLLAAVMGDAPVAGQPADAARLSSKADEFSAAKKRYYKRPYVRTEGPRYSAYLKGPDPSLGPDGLPYRVPAHLRGQCYFDEGYGRFRACPNR